MGSSTDKAYLFIHYWRTLAPPDLLNLLPEMEYRFHEKRKWRIDFAWVSRRVGVEVDGNSWQTRGGGRHMTDADLEKRNCALSMGWRVFHFSPGMLEKDPQGCVDLVAEALR